MPRRLRSLGFRMALAYGAFVAAAMIVISVIFYFGTVGALERGIDRELYSASARLIHRYEASGAGGLRQDILQLLGDGIDQDTEVYLLLDGTGRAIAGNIAAPGDAIPVGRFIDLAVTRYGRHSTSRILAQRLANGYVLVVGRDTHELRRFEQLFWQALLIGGFVALLLAVGSAAALRRLLDQRVAAIRRTAREIEAGDLDRRIPQVDADDEFARLNQDINRMLDRIQHLMAGVRDVSNAVAHDLRTPLGRVRALLEDTLRRARTADQFRDALRDGIAGIDDLMVVFDKLLQIAEAESGTRRQSFHPVLLDDVIIDVVELYDATAEANGIALTIEGEGGRWVLGDRHLLTTALANLVDNALKYAGRGATVRVGGHRRGKLESLVVEDDGLGIPAEERGKVLTRFYRLDRSRSLPGNGLGLTIAAAVSQLHGGRLTLSDARPGLRARMVLPCPEGRIFPNGNLPETVRITERS